MTTEPTTEPVTGGRRDRLVGWARGLSERQVLLHLGAAHVVLALVLLPRVWHVPVIGDEAQYVDGAKALGNLLRDWGALRSPNTAELDRSVVASGWFMPGMSAVLSPLYLLVPHAPMGLARAYLAVFHTLLLFAAVRSVHRTFGYRYAAALLVLPGLVPVWVLFGSGAWGDLAAGMLVVLLLCDVVRIFRGFIAGEAPGWRAGLRFGLLAIGTLYLRASAVPLLAGLFVLFLLGLVVFLRGRVRLRALGALVLAAVAFVAVLLPWSLYASQALDSRVVTTTTLPTVLAQSFGDRDRVCYGPCDPGSTLWFAPVRYARETDRASGVSETEILGQMSDYALEDVTLTGYARDVGAGFGRYTLQASGYEFWFRPGTRHREIGPLDAATRSCTPAPGCSTGRRCCAAWSRCSPSPAARASGSSPWWRSSCSPPRSWSSPSCTPAARATGRPSPRSSPSRRCCCGRCAATAAAIPRPPARSRPGCSAARCCSRCSPASSPSRSPSCHSSTSYNADPSALR